MPADCFQYILIVKKKYIVLVISALFLCLYFLYLKNGYYNHQYVIVFPGITLYEENEGNLDIAGGCFNKCNGGIKFLSCEKEQTYLKYSWKECRYLCVGDFRNNCPHFL